MVPFFKIVGLVSRSNLFGDLFERNPNMFNNLYGVSLTEPSRTPELILKLSELMRAISVGT
ncbi:MAG: hypothetical protein ACN6PN_24025 [Sphingobacterium sp.]